MKALIPVAGIGTRLRPHTWTVPKALINVAGKTILGHIVDILLEAGIEEYIFVTGHMGDRVREWAEETYDIPMEWVVQKEMAGLGHAVLQAGNEVAGEPVFVVLGDTIFKADIGGVVERGGNSLGVMEVDDPSRFGVVVVEGEKVVKLVEKPDQPISHLAIAGLYHIAESDLLLASLERLVSEDIRTRGEYQLTDALALMLEGGATFRTFPLEAWYDCGVPQTVLETNHALLETSGGHVSENGEQTVIVPPVYIGEGAELTGSVVGPHTTVGAGTAIRGSVVRDSIIGQNSVVEGAVLDASIVGDNCSVRGRPLNLNIGDSSTIDRGGARMTDLLVVGSVALDSVETPSGTVDEALGGSATYFSAAASLLTGVRVVAVVGDDFPEEHLETLRGREIDLEGLQRVPGRTFRWSGRYTGDLNQAVTLDTQLNVFESFDPELPEAYRDSAFVFLANLHPALQLKVLEQTPDDAFTGADTMNFWIDGERQLLDEVFRRVRCVTINEAEVMQYSGESNLFRAIRSLEAMGPEYIVVKRGAYGAMLWHAGEIFFIPAYPVETVVDPTGAGDSFAGGLFGWLASRGSHGDEDLRRGLLAGTVLASFNVEDFSPRRLFSISRDDIAKRAGQFERMIHIGSDGSLF